MCREEGVILKDLDSKWEPSDRGTKWLKLKPDYIHAESDLDVIIIGEYFVQKILLYGAVVKILGSCLNRHFAVFYQAFGYQVNHM